MEYVMQIKSKELYTYMHKYSMQHNHTVYTGLSTTSASLHKLESKLPTPGGARGSPFKTVTETTLSLCPHTRPASPGCTAMDLEAVRGGSRPCASSNAASPAPSPAPRPLPPSRPPALPRAASLRSPRRTQALVADPRRRPSSPALFSGASSGSRFSGARLCTSAQAKGVAV